MAPPGGETALDQSERAPKCCHLSDNRGLYDGAPSGKKRTTNQNAPFQISTNQNEPQNLAKFTDSKRHTTHRYHIYRVSPQYGYEYVSSKYNCVRIVHHMYNICRVFLQYGYGRVSSNYNLLRIVHHRYHIYRVSPQYGYEQVSSNDNFLRIVHHRVHICRVSPQYG